MSTKKMKWPLNRAQPVFQGRAGLGHLEKGHLESRKNKMES